MTTIKTKIDNFYLWFGDQPGREKISFGGGEAGVHYTIIFKGDKRVVDIHKTIELADGKKDYEQILEMRWRTNFRNALVYSHAFHRNISQGQHLSASQVLVRQQN